MKNIEALNASNINESNYDNGSRSKHYYDNKEDYIKEGVMEYKTH